MTDQREQYYTDRTMIDSAYPLHPEPVKDITLVYIGGDTPHPWTAAEIGALQSRYIWPCFVRSNPGQVNVVTDVGACVARLHELGIPKGTCVILDLETAVDTEYVHAFNTGLAAAGYKTAKYGSLSTIWRNPQTSGGTFVADPEGNRPHMVTTGDTVATQWGFEGAYDLSLVLPQAAVPLWDTQPDQPPPPPIPDWQETIMNRLPLVRYGDDDRKTGHRWVRRVQGLLLAAGEDVGQAGVDGVYGPATRDALKRLEAARGLLASGLEVDRHRWAVLVTGGDL